MKTVRLESVEGYRKNDYLTCINGSFEGCIIHTTEKAILVDMLTGSWAKPYKEVWVPKSKIEFAGGLEFIAENASESNSRNLNVEIPYWLLRKLERGY